MHEAGAVRAALDPVVSGWSGDGGGRGLELVIVDATRAEADAVGFLARAMLDDRGLGRASVAVRVLPRACALCGESSVPSPTDPLCGSCGGPMPPAAGPAIVGREAGVPSRPDGDPRPRS
jgi:hypothetical protein